jgi:transcriptional antiterminator RfaH
MAPGWYVLRSKPTKEEFFWGQLMARFIETYSPCIHAKKASLHAHKDQPYFPGLLFVHVDLQETPTSFLEGLPGSRGRIMVDDLPIIVPDALISAIRGKVDQINSNNREELPGLHVEEAPATQECPLSWYDIILDSCLSGNARVQRLHWLLRSRLLPVELPGVERV